MMADRHETGSRIWVLLYFAGLAFLGLALLGFFAAHNEARGDEIAGSYDTTQTRMGYGFDAYARSERSGVQIVGRRPAGAPYRYCGFASAIRVGLDNRNGHWNLARNWYAFPRSSPGPMKALVRNGHVSIIEGGGPGAWHIFDPNSGGGLTRRYTTARLRGTVVDPQAPVRLARRR